mmetsp:Transcript_43012/g.92228  ORF Transcript_43012/g.92228 Transcript_43012/m.92228 type:complete len:181 (-) Transcript_43012:14-556(-)
MLSTYLRRAAGAAGASMGLGVAFWEYQRQAILMRYEAGKLHYEESGGESRYPFYGRDHGYEVDYMLELELQEGDRILATYRPAALHPWQAAALQYVRWREGRAFDDSCRFKGSYDEEAVIEVDSGRRFCRHPPRPDHWSKPWKPGGDKDRRSFYSDWLAAPYLNEVLVVRKLGGHVMTIR